MMLPVKHDTSEDELISSSSLETLRSRVLQKIECNNTLTTQEKIMGIRELDFLIEYERLCRLRRAVWQWRDDKRERTYSQIARRDEVVNRLRIARKETALSVARMNRDLIRYRIDALRELRKLRPADEFESHLKKAKVDLRKLNLQRRFAKARRRASAQDLEEQVLHRAKFLRRIRETYPEMEEELTDDYDRREFQHSGRPK